MNPGDIDLYGCTINSERGRFDLTSFGGRNLVYSFSVYESIWTPGITADIKVYDLNNLLDIYKIIGDEVVFLTFGVAGDFDSV